MTRKLRSSNGTADRPSGSDRGFTLSETIIVVFLIAIVAAIAVNSYQNSIERARMASCMNELRGIQAALWYDSDGGNKTIDPKAFWETHYNGTRPGPFVLLLDSAGAGSGSDESGVGAGAEGQDSPAFVVVGRYEHWAPGEYVFIEDDQPPQFVKGQEEDPGYGRRFDWEAGKQWGPGSAGGQGPTQGVGFAGTDMNGSGAAGGSSGGGGQPSGWSAGGGTTAGSTTGSGNGRNTTSRLGD